MRPLQQIEGHLLNRLNIDLLKAISFAGESMKTFSNYGEKLKIKLDFHLT